MTLERFLEKFDGAATRPRGGSGGADLDAARAAAYEAGYASGWDDAMKAEEKAQGHVDAEFQRNVRDLGFTYHEAVGAVRGELGRFLSALTETFLPRVLPEMTRARLADELRALAEAGLDLPVELVVSPDSRAQVQAMTAGDMPFDLSLVEDETLAPSQIFLRFGGEERAIDLVPLAEALARQVAALVEPQGEDEEARSHG